MQELAVRLLHLHRPLNGDMSNNREIFLTFLEAGLKPIFLTWDLLCSNKVQ